MTLSLKNVIISYRKKEELRNELNPTKQFKTRKPKIWDDFKALEQNKKLVILQQIEDLLDQISELEIELELDNLEESITRKGTLFLVE